MDISSVPVRPRGHPSRVYSDLIQHSKHSETPNVLNFNSNPNINTSTFTFNNGASKDAMGKHNFGNQARSSKHLNGDHEANGYDSKCDDMN